MKKILLFLSLVFIFPSVLFSKSQNFSFFIRPEAGITIGKLGEYLYADSTQKSLKSYLEWQKMPLYNIGAAAGGSFKSFHFDTSFHYALPITCGKMYDKDWQGNIQTNLGTFDNKAVKNYSVNTNLSYLFSVKEIIDFGPVLNFVYSYSSFSGENGTGLYGDRSYSSTGTYVPYDSEYAKKVNLYGITYKRQSLYTFAGIEGTITKFNFINTAKLFISPFSTFLAEDYHSAGNETGKDYTMRILSNAFFRIFKFHDDMEFNISDSLSIVLSSDFIISPVLKSESETNFYRGYSVTSEGMTYSEWTYLGFVSGMDVKELNLSLSCKITF